MADETQMLADMVKIRVDLADAVVTWLDLCVEVDERKAEAIDAQERYRETRRDECRAAMRRHLAFFAARYCSANSDEWRAVAQELDAIAEGRDKWSPDAARLWDLRRAAGYRRGAALRRVRKLAEQYRAAKDAVEQLLSGGSNGEEE